MDHCKVAAGTSRPERSEPELWGVNLLAQDFSSGGTEFKKGDLILSLDDGQNNPDYRRLLRRIPARVK